ncbi:hypothetical protein [Amycolatopsis anabasis]|uniref:hypothetical protein n=1 Tax=Amycolatopsis anabasis TaxID=1840409 RepID=UPI00131B090C|nr:hypothetical protein [Amycolatopsis anabasis]
MSGQTSPAVAVVLADLGEHIQQFENVGPADVDLGRPVAQLVEFDPQRDEHVRGLADGDPADRPVRGGSSVAGMLDERGEAAATA